MAGFPGQGVYDNATQETYVPTGTNASGTSEITVINKKNVVVKTFTLPTNWGAVTAALNPITRKLYVGAEDGGLFVLNPKTGVLIGYVNVSAVSVVVNQFTNKVYVSDFVGTLNVIDGATDNIIKSIPVNGIENIAINPVTNRVYAAQDYFPGQVTVINGQSDTILTTVQAGSGLTFSVTVDPLTNTFYSSEELGTVTVYDGKTNQRKAVIAIPGQPATVICDPSEKKAYVTDSADNKVYIIDTKTNTVTGGLTVGATPQYMTIDSVHDLLYVGNTGQTDANGNPVFSLSVIKE